MLPVHSLKELIGFAMFFIASASAADLIWSDEFDGAAIDQGKWGYDILPAYKYNNELQEYTSASANSFVKDGLLHISAVPMGDGRYTSARMVSRNKGNWMYGTVKVRASIPLGEGLWPAIWMLPTDSTNKWPKGGEIDIMEHVTCDANRVHATVHTGAYNWPMNTQVGTSISVHDVRDFHEYALEWSPTVVKVLLDGNEYFSFDNDNTKDVMTWPFDEPFHLILNIAVGGNWGGYCLNGKKPSFPSNGEESTMLVDYVRVYAGVDADSTPVTGDDIPCDQPQLDYACEWKIKWMLENWDKVDWADAYAAHGVDGTRCSIQRYLFNREGFCTDPDIDLVKDPPSASPAASTTPSATSASSTTPTSSAKPTPLPTLSPTAMRLPGNRQSCVVDPRLSLEIACGSAIQICARANINCAVTPSVTTCSVVVLNEIFSLYHRANAYAESACNSAGSAMLNTCVAKTGVAIGDVCNSMAWACSSGGVDCSDIAGCTTLNANKAFSRYHRKHGFHEGTCDFTGSATSD